MPLSLPSFATHTHQGSAHLRPLCVHNLYVLKTRPGSLTVMPHCHSTPLHPATQVLIQVQRQPPPLHPWPSDSPAGGTQPQHQPGPRSHHTRCPRSLSAKAPLGLSNHPHPQAHEVHPPLKKVISGTLVGWVSKLGHGKHIWAAECG